MENTDPSEPSIEPPAPMSTTTPKPILDALAGRACPRPPVWLMRQAGRYLPEYRAMRAQVGGFLELCYTPEMAAEVTLQPIRRYGFDAAILFSDILVVPDALGQPVRFVEGEGPLLDPVRDEGAIARLAARPAEARRAHLAPVYEAVARIRAELPPETALIGFAGAPWTVACYIVEGHGSKGFETAKRLAYGAPETFDRLIRLVVDTTVDHLLGQIAAGAEVVQLFDTWAGLLDEAGFQRWVIGPTREVIDRLRETAPDVPVIGFPRGAGALYGAYQHETGVRGLGLDPAVPMAEARRLQRNGPVQGNLDPVWLMVGGEGMDRAVDELLAELGQGPWIFSLGHGVHLSTDPDSVSRLVARIRSDR